MAGFDRYRFVEAFAAALLGAYIHSTLKGGNASAGSAQDAAQKFQRSLLLASSHEAFTETVSLRYKQRVGLLGTSPRLRYIKLTLQPSQSQCDERLTALMIFDHALQSNIEWEATLRMLSLDESSSATNASKIIEEISKGVSGTAKTLNAAVATRADAIRRKQENEPRFKKL